MIYDDLLLRIGPASGGGLQVHASSPGVGEAAAGLVLSRRLEQWLREPGGAEAGAELGYELFQALFAEEVGALFQQARGSASGSAGRGLRLKLQLDVREARLAALHALPWEALRPRPDGFYLALGRPISLVRSVDVPRGSQRPEVAPPLRILGVFGGDDGQASLNAHGEWHQIEKAWEKGGARADLLPGSTPRMIREALVSGGHHVLHVMGHGLFRAEAGEGTVLLTDEMGLPRLVTGTELAEQLQDLDSLRLVFLNACDTAIQSAHQPFAGVATALLRAGIPAVIAMQRPISDEAALAFCSRVYERFAKGDSLDAAVAEGRLALKAELSTAMEWSTPALFLRTNEGRLGVRAIQVEAPAPVTEAPTERPRQRPIQRSWAALGGVLLAVGALSVGWAVWRGSALGPVPQGGKDSDIPTVIMTPIEDKPAAKPPEPVIEAPKPATPRSRRLSSGQSAQFPEIGASVSAQFFEDFGQPMVSIRVTAGGKTVTRSLMGPGRIEVGGIAVEVEAIDFSSQRVTVRGVK